MFLYSTTAPENQNHENTKHETIQKCSCLRFKNVLSYGFVIYKFLALTHGEPQDQKEVRAA